jgi:hypothetical protein
MLQRKGYEKISKKTENAKDVKNIVTPTNERDAKITEGNKKTSTRIIWHGAFCIDVTISGIAF